MTHWVDSGGRDAARHLLEKEEAKLRELVICRDAARREITKVRAEIKRLKALPAREDSHGHSGEKLRATEE